MVIKARILLNDGHIQTIKSALRNAQNLTAQGKERALKVARRLDSNQSEEISLTEIEGITIFKALLNCKETSTHQSSTEIIRALMGTSFRLPSEYFGYGLQPQFIKRIP